MNKLILILLNFFLIQTLTVGQQEAKTSDGKTVLLFEDSSWFYADSVPLYYIKTTTITKLEIPRTNPNDAIIAHLGYSLSYNEKHEQANWVAYELTKEETKKLFDRTDKFLVDPQVKTGTAIDMDYSHSGYDRGHLAPASDMGWSSTSMAESFYYSNMSPQAPGFNRGIWKNLEELVRTWAVENNNIYIVTGPVLTNGLQTIGANKVSVPHYFYKVILDYTEPNIKGIGFVIPNKGSAEPLQHFAVSLDSIEKLTGINFYPMLPDDQEEIIEKTLCIKCWSWNSSNKKSIAAENESNSNISENKIENKESKNTQCTGITKDGGRCKRTTNNANRLCWQHASD